MNALLPVGEDASAVGDVVVEFGVGFPFVDVVAEHRLGVAGAEDDGIRISHRGVARHLMKRRGRRVHPRPDAVGAEAEEQFKNTRVSLRAEVADFRLKCFRGPRLQPPILVVDEDAAILHSGLIHRLIAE